MHEIELLTPPSELDLRKELDVVNGALNTAITRGERIRREIAETNSIAALVGLHDALELITEEQQAAEQRQRELIELLAN